MRPGILTVHLLEQAAKPAAKAKAPAAVGKPALKSKQAPSAASHTTKAPAAVEQHAHALKGKQQQANPKP